MRFRLPKSLLSIIAALLALPALAQTPPPSHVAPGAFDFYVFTLSWSPGFCDTGGAAKSPDQCAIGSGQGFVVHGLWPDNYYSADPADCGYQYVPPAALALTRGTYPNEGLARYEYEKHGTCSGLSPSDYFSAVKYLREQIVTPDVFKAPHDALRLAPDDIARAFSAANANLHLDNLAVTCGHGELEDVRICVSKDLRAFAVCQKVASRTCRSPQITVAPLR